MLGECAFERTARSTESAHHRAFGYVENLGDLGVPEPADIRKDEDLAGRFGKLLEDRAHRVPVAPARDQPEGVAVLTRLDPRLEAFVESRALGVVGDPLGAAIGPPPAVDGLIAQDLL